MSLSDLSATKNLTRFTLYIAMDVSNHIVCMRKTVLDKTYTLKSQQSQVYIPSSGLALSRGMTEKVEVYAVEPEQTTVSVGWESPTDHGCLYTHGL